MVRDRPYLPGIWQPMYRSHCYSRAADRIREAEWSLSLSARVGHATWMLRAGQVPECYFGAAVTNLESRGREAARGLIWC